MIDRPAAEPVIRIGLLTGGQDPHYSFGLATSLADAGVSMDFIGSDELDTPGLRASDLVRFLNLRGSQKRNASPVEKVRRVAVYYGRLLWYAATATPRVFHILWNNKIELFDRTLLMAYYRALGRKLVMTAHNVNAGRRDGTDSLVNRVSLRAQYRLCDHIFVHTNRMKRELIEQFGVSPGRVTVIPYGLNNAVLDSSLTPSEAKRHFGIHPAERTILFFGQIGPYKGLDVLVTAFEALLERRQDYRLMVAGKPKPGADQYWSAVLRRLQPHIAQGRVIADIRHIPDDETELYFKAADVLVLPYREIFQSGILFLGYSFGLPVVATDVGSLKDDVLEGRTGMVCRPESPEDLAASIARYFDGDLFRALDRTRLDIRTHLKAEHSWDVVAGMTRDVYAQLLGHRDRRQGRSATREALIPAEK